MKTRGLKRDTRGIGGSIGLYAGIGLVALIAFLLFAIFFPALLLALMFFVAGIFTFIYLKAHPYGVWIGVAFLVIAAIFGFAQVGQQASLSLVNGLP